MKALPLRLRRINAKGLEVATRLAELKAGKDLRLGQLVGLQGEAPGLRPEERLERFLKKINHARQRWNDGTLGTCVACGEQLDDASVDEIPWLERCGPCAEEERL